MNLRIATLIASCLMGCLSANPVADVVPTNGEVVNEIRSVDEALSLLSDEHFVIREEASRYLWSEGKEVRNRLSQLLDSEDPELVYRAEELLNKIDSGVLPDTPPEIAAHVGRYQGLGEDGKIKIMVALQELGAYPQMYALYHAEQNIKEFKSLDRYIQRVTPSAVRSILQEGEVEDAFRIIELSGESDQSLRLWASIIHWQDRVDEVLRDLEGDDERSQRKKLALYRASDMREEVATMAKEMNRNDLLVSLAVQKGDREMFLRHFSNIPQFKPIRDEIWAVEKSRQADDFKMVETLVNELDEGLKEKTISSGQLIVELMSLGKRDAALELMGQAELRKNTSLLVANAELRQLFELYGIDWDVGVSQQWIDDQLRVDLDKDEWWFIDDESTLFVIAQQLRQLRDYKTVELMLAPLWAKATNNEEKVDFITQLSSQGFYYSSLLLLEGEVTEQTEEMYKLAILSNTKIYEQCWSESQVLFPEMRFSDRIRLVIEFVRGQPIGETKQDSVALLLEHIEQKVDSLDGVALKEWEQALKVIYEANGFHQKSRTLLETQYQREMSFQSCYELVLKYLYLNEWQQASQLVVSKAFDSNQNEINLLLFKAGVMHLGGMEEEANALFRQLDLYILDDPLTLLSASEMMLQIGCLAKSYDYYEVALQVSSPSGDDAARWFALMNQGKTLNARKDDWEKAFICAQVRLYSLLNQSLLSGFRGEKQNVRISFIPLLQERFYCDLYLASANIKQGNHSVAEQLLGFAGRQKIGNGLLGDDYFPLLVQSGKEELLTKIHEETYQRISGVISRFPNASDQKNTLAWVSSRAARKLEESKQLMEEVLKAEPRNAAYLDTTAEVYFALKDRKTALKFSKRAWQDAQSNQGAQMIKEQYFHFRDDPFPRP